MTKDDMKKAVEDARRKLGAASVALHEQRRTQDAEKEEAEALGTGRLREFTRKMTELGVAPCPARELHIRTKALNSPGARRRTKVLQDRRWGMGWFAYGLFVTTDLELYMSTRHESGDRIEHWPILFAWRISEERTSWTRVPNDTTSYEQHWSRDLDTGSRVPLLVSDSLERRVAEEIERQAKELGPL